MKGTPFVALRDVVHERAGDDAWDDVLERTGLDGTWTTLGTYEHDELVALVAGAADVLGVPQATLLRATGTQAVRLVLGQQPEITSRHPDAVAMVSALEVLFRTEVRKIDRDASPVLRTAVTGEHTVELDYGAPFPQCLLLEGVALGIGEYYETPLAVEQVTCTGASADRCLLCVRLVGAGTDGPVP